MDNDNLVELDHYLNGQCHTLAVALHRHLGWELVAVLNDDAFFWEDPEDPDNGIPEVIHVYAVDPNHQAWDIRGSRPADQVVADAADWFAISEQSLSTDWMKSELELATYVGEGIDDEGNEFDRPLFAYTDTDVAQAWADAVKHLPLPPAAPPPSPIRPPRP